MLHYHTQPRFFATAIKKVTYSKQRNINDLAFGLEILHILVGKPCPKKI
ncbi:hypothetical protein pah_c012o008 [Parachlamydia acanthamoebae str. Hall's coccus]|nr:hypothetical protein pah_c012o008 [Parachlamydia acanthamoebae str. Hall's coccus]